MAVDQNGRLIEDYTSKLMPYISVEKGINATRMIMVDKKGNPVNFHKTVKDSWSGSVSDEFTWGTSMSYFGIINDGAAVITVKIITDDGPVITIPVDVGENYGNHFDPFKEVEITTTSPYRAEVLD